MTLPRLLALALATSLLPAVARADDPPERKGFAFGFAVTPGAIAMGRGFAAATRVRQLLGGAITDRVVLASELGLQVVHGSKKVGFLGDVVLQGFVGRGFYVRGATGVVTNSPALARDRLLPSVGGAIGIGYEFQPVRRFGVALGLDYDVRMRTDRTLSQGIFLGVRFTGYPRK